MRNSFPNIVITGTPGTGKSTHSSLLASTYTSPSGSSSNPLRQMDIGALVKEKNFYVSYDEEWQSYEVNEDQVLDELEPLSGGRAPEPLDEGEDESEEVAEAKALTEDDESRGGLILDWHTCDVWPERWVDLVVVLRCDHQVLWQRLEKRSVPPESPNTSIEVGADIPATAEVTRSRRFRRTTRPKSWASSWMMLAGPTPPKLSWNSVAKRAATLRRTSRGSSSGFMPGGSNAVSNRSFPTHIVDLYLYL